MILARAAFVDAAIEVDDNKIDDVENNPSFAANIVPSVVVVVGNVVIVIAAVDDVNVAAVACGIGLDVVKAKHNIVEAIVDTKR